MTRRTFLFCDRCNLDATRAVELRRTSSRGDGRRFTDDRSWFEGGEDEAVQSGWTAVENGSHFCPRCSALLSV